MKKLMSLIISIVMIICMCGCSKKDEGPVKAQIVFKDYGTVVLELYPDVAPITVRNFVELSESGFYDGLTIHRIMPGFVIQGGDPEGTGFGGSEKTITGEFSDNGHENNISHERGVISMARNSVSMDSASSQFFICLDNVSSLDGSYAAFGRVIEGMDVVDSIAKVAPEDPQSGFVNPDDQPVIESITILE